MITMKSITTTCIFKNALWSESSKKASENPFHLYLVALIIVIFIVILTGPSPISISKNSWFIFILGLKQWQHYFIHMMSWYWDEIVNIQQFLLSMFFYIFNLERPLITYRLTFSIRELFLLYISPSLPNFFLLHNQGFFISLSVLFWVLMMLI